MKIWTFCICRNERVIMPYFLRHYGAFADRMVFWDGGSTDGTRELIAAHPKADLRDWPGSPGVVDDEFLAFANTHWQEAKGQADWVMWPDADEFIYHPCIRSVLDAYLLVGVNIPRIQGFGMVSRDLPVGDGQIWEEIKTGFPSPEWCKPVVFQPASEIRWCVGRHSLDTDNMPPFTTSTYPDLKLCHYRYLGERYTLARNEGNYTRMPERCRRSGYGKNCYPGATEPYSSRWFQTVKDNQFPNVI